MSATIDHAKELNALLRSLHAAGSVDPFTKREPLDELLYSMLLWEAPRTKAEAGIKRLLASVIDHNELRVTRPEEIAQVLGKTYPQGQERAERIKAVLSEIYIREYAVSLESPLSQNKREARKYLDTLEGMPGFASSRVMLMSTGAHAMPVDGRLLSKLIEHGILEEDTDETTATGILERHMKAGEGSEAHLLLQSWVDGVLQIKGGRKTKSTSARPGKKKTSRPSVASHSGVRR